MQPDIDDAYRRFFPAIREKCARMLQDVNEAQDVAQETFVRLWRSGLATGDGRTVVAWIYRTSTRLAIDRMRRRRAGTELSCELASLPAGGPDAEQALAIHQSWARLARSIPARELELALLARVDGLTQRELAEVSGMSDRSVRRLLARLDARLERLARDEEDGHGR